MRIQAEEVENRGVHIRHIVGVLHRVKAELIGTAVDGAPP